MIAGPIPLETLAKFFGTSAEIVKSWTTDSVQPLPCTKIALGKRDKICVYFLPLLEWLNRSTSGTRWTEETLDKELTRLTKTEPKEEAA
jgi:hypothetical protein